MTPDKSSGLIASDFSIWRLNLGTVGGYLISRVTASKGFFQADV